MDSSFNSILLCSLHSLYWFQDISLGQGLGHQYFTFRAMFTFPATENTASAMKGHYQSSFHLGLMSLLQVTTHFPLSLERRFELTMNL